MIYMSYIHVHCLYSLGKTKRLRVCVWSKFTGGICISHMLPPYTYRAGVDKGTGVGEAMRALIKCFLFHCTQTPVQVYYYAIGCVSHREYAGCQRNCMLLATLSTHAIYDKTWHIIYKIID